MQMPKRSTAGAFGYRYGFNGKENDNEVKGLGNQQDYGMRIYDSRLGRFLSVDPIAIEYPWNSSYAYAEDDPISNIDLDGLEKVKSTGFMSFIGTGLKKGLNEFTSGVKSTSKAVFKGETYKGSWQSIKNYGSLAMKDPNAAIKLFNRGLSNFSVGVSNTVQHYTTQPVMWTLDIPNRSLEENLIGIGYGLWKAGELYVLFKLPEAVEGDGIFATSRKSSKVDLMGGATSRYGKGWTNFDLAATSGIADDVANFGKHFGKNTVTEIIVNNPQAEFLKHVHEALKEGGTITVRGTLSNKYFRQVYEGKAAGIENFEVTEIKPNIPNDGYKKTNGEDIKGQIREIRLKKKTKTE